jgi:periplasmic divalent cation tolerance protein
MMAEYIEVHTTIDSREAAQKIAETLVSRRLAACVQVSGPITSTYWWQGKMEQAEEWLCTAKTRRELYDQLEQTIREVHSYDVPEILAVKVVAGNADYLNWLSQETKE